MTHRDYTNSEQMKELFLDELMKARGIKSIAYKKAGIGKGMFFKWQREDTAFSEAIKDVEERWLDVVENKLIDLIAIGDKAALMFYLKAKGKHRGYR